jgi:hypothetical protein
MYQAHRQVMDKPKWRHVIFYVSDVPFVVSVEMADSRNGRHVIFYVSLVLSLA